MLGIHGTIKYGTVDKLKTCPVNKAMTKINEDHKDKTRLKLDEKDIFQPKTNKKVGCCEKIKNKFRKKSKSQK